jgi:hypothetical protein
MPAFARHAIALLGPALILAVSGCSSDSGSSDSGSPPPPEIEDRAYYILPPGNYGGIPPTENSLDQLPLYDGLTPLRGDITDQDIEELFLPADFVPIGETTEEPTGREGTEILYDEFGIAHITGETRADLAFGAGWVTARDRLLLLTLGRGPARAAVCDVPGVNPFELLLTGQSFVPSEECEQLVTDQVDLLVEVYGEEGQEIVDDAQAFADGMNAYSEANGGLATPWTVNDTVATTAFIGSIFGAGGGAEATNADYLSKLIDGLGEEEGRLAWDDTMLFEDPEAPTTIDVPFEYGTITGGDVTGAVTIDADSIISFDPVAETPEASAALGSALIPAAGPPPSRQASNWLLIDSAQSTNDNILGVMGPQLGYYYPEIVMQLHLSGPGIEAQGAAVPGLSMYLLIGRTRDYAWSLTSATHDVRDVYAEVLCNPDGSDPTRESTHYIYEGECIPFEIFDAGTLGGVPIVYPVSVHGQFVGTATSNGEPVALTSKRSTFGRDALNLGALKDMTEGDAATPEEFWTVANQFGFTFNWAYISRTNIAYFSSGLLPVRAAGLDRRLPTLGTGEYEWEGFLEEDEHPHSAEGPSGRLLNWNNQAAPGFMHGDNRPYGSVHRVQLFDQFPERVDLAGVVGVMNRSATEDVRTPAWPAVSEVLRGGEAPSTLAGEVVDFMDSWVAEDAPRLDADDNGDYDSAGPTIMDELWGPLVEAAMRPVFGDLIEELNEIRNLGGNAISGNNGSSLIDKDLRTLLGQDVQGPFNLSYCGAGDLEDCRTDLWQAVDEVAQALAVEYGDEDPSTWLKEASRTGFIPGLIPETMRTTNRPTYQQLLELAPNPSSE